MTPLPPPVLAPSAISNFSSTCIRGLSSHRIASGVGSLAVRKIPKMVIGVLSVLVFLNTTVRGADDSAIGTIVTKTGVASERHMNIQLDLKACDVGGKPTPFSLFLQLRDGRLKAGFGRGMNAACHAVVLREGDGAGKQPRLSLTVELADDGWLQFSDQLASVELVADGDGWRHGQARWTAGGKTIQSDFTGIPLESFAEPRRLRLRCRPSPAAFKEFEILFWATVRPDGVTDGYVFDRVCDGPAESSTLTFTEHAIAGSFRYRLNHTKNPQQQVDLAGATIGDQCGGTFVTSVGGLSGTFNGVWLPLTPSRPTKVEAPATQPPAIVRVHMPKESEAPTNKQKRYPVVYNFGRSTPYVFRDFLTLMAERGKLPPMIVCDLYENMSIKIQGSGADTSLDVVVAWMDAHYPTVANRRSRLVTGFSAGTHVGAQYLDRGDMIGGFLLFSHPLRDSGWPEQKAREREALLRGRTGGSFAGSPPDILWVGAQHESGWRGPLRMRDLLVEEFDLRSTYLECPGVPHNWSMILRVRCNEITEWIAGFLAGDEARMRPAFVRPTTVPSIGDGVRIAFQPPGLDAPTGWRVDCGEVFGFRPGGLWYGWHHASSSHFRHIQSYPGSYYTEYYYGGTWEVLSSFVQMPGDDNPAREVDKHAPYQARIPQPRWLWWEIALPNGTYTVRLLGGAPDGAGANRNPPVTGIAHRFMVQGQEAMNGESDAKMNKAGFFDVRIEATVTDERLRIWNSPDANLATLAGVEIAPQSSGTAGQSPLKTLPAPQR